MFILVALSLSSRSNQVAVRGVHSNLKKLIDELSINV